MIGARGRGRERRRARGAIRALLLAGTVMGLLSVSTAPAMAASNPTIGYQQAYATANGARPEAFIDPEGSATTCAVEYVSTEAFAISEWADAKTQDCVEPLGEGTSEVRMLAEIGGLAIDTTYHYRFLATNAVATVTGPEATFVTFGIKSFALEALGAGAEADTQAGGHPYSLTTHIVFNTNPGKNFRSAIATAEDATLRDVKVALPPGLIGNPTAVARCSRYAAERFECKPESQVGILEIVEPNEGILPRPLFNVIPPEGVAARFSARFNNFGNAFIDAKVRSGEDYGVDADSLHIADLAPIKAINLTMWGVPALAAHTPERYCAEGGSYVRNECASEEEAHPKPFLTMPTACAGPLSTGLAVDSYQNPGEFTGAISPMGPITGCSQLQFKPSLETAPTTAASDSPSGMNVTLAVPQDENPEQNATSDLKNATITFPPGMAVNPSQADGLAACPETGKESVGFTGFAELNPQAEPGVKTAQFTPAPATCPEASKLGTVKIVTPLLDHPIEGGLYLATPHANPFGSLVAVYLAVYDPISGVVIKLPGEVHLDPSTGQVSTRFDQNPQLPFEKLEVDLFKSEKRAAFTTPETCGSFSGASVLTPWDGNPAATPSSVHPFEITSEPMGGPCPATEAQAPNAPGLSAGTVSPIAGTYSPFVLNLTRQDGSQRFGALAVTLPEGMIGKVAGVQECPPPDIEAAEHLTAEGDGAVEVAHPSCPAGSLLGVVHVGAGSGKPLYVNGRVYFAGPYKGAPFSLVIVTPAVAGPLDLGTVVVRAALFIDPETAQVTVRSDPFPSVLDGIPLDIRSVGVEMTRPDFTLNPTSCNPMEVVGQEISTAGQAAALKDRFQVGGCNGMPFNPTFTAMVQAHHTRKEGAYFKASVEAHPGQANISKVEVQLPKALSVRDETLKQACSEAQFASNPAGCPAGSFVGSATAYTPILNVPLSGPAIFVSHGGKQFPDMDVVLQGEGVTIKLRSGTFVDEAGYTFSKFEGVPDAPISRFELTLPPGPHSALAGNGNLCYRTITKTKRVLLRKHGHLIKRHKHLVHKTKKTRHTVKRLLQMPTLMIGQNGVDVHQKTHLTVTGCGKAHASGHKHHSKHHKKHKKHKKHRHKGQHKHGTRKG